MLQFSSMIRSTDDVAVCIRRAREQLPETCTGLLISIFTVESDPKKILGLARQLGKAFPAAAIVGSMTTDVIYNGGVRVNAAVVGFSAFQSSEVRVAAFDQLDTLSEDGKKFCAQAKRLKHLAAVGIFGTLHAVDIQPFLDRLAPLDENVVIFGGGANTLQNAPACVFTKDKVIKEGLVAVLFSGPDLHVHASLNFGWKPLGREFVITKMEGEHVVTEIDHQPAARIYEKYLGVPADKHFSRDTLAFPVFVRRGNSYVARHTVDCREDGALLFIADLHEGETIRLSYGDPGEMVKDAKVGYTDMAAFRPEGLLVLSCYAHRMFLHGDVKFELAHAREIAPSFGFYTYGEIFRFAENIGIHNMMLLTVGFREGEKPAKPLPVRGEMPTRLKDSLLIVERLVRFVSATTAELEAANVELDRMARTDRLTKIANRGETESVLKQAITFAQTNRRPVSVLMLDIDNFKRINDTYGHDVGDHVLTATSGVLRAHVRLGDTVGRWGGEEFLLILLEADEKTAAEIADCIREDIAALRVLPDGKGFTASFGVARIAPGESFEAFYQRVDGALYQAKHGGKNRVCLAKK
ncbi:MAG: diguanylate cyclase [Schwartzia sp.]|nr:diguanylate cyclase [Schwartzia sp. (in: firmicutes)]